VRDVLMHRHVNQKAVDTVELLTSEVVTNALVHARSVGVDPDEGPDLVVRIGRGFVRVEVYDVSPEVPVRRTPGPLDPSGRGMWIVDELARDWGVDHMPSGKRVWFEVAFRISPLAAWARGRST
jgi:anti-sigma regulatory factor (Ser/Thr protein kinase)